MVSWSNLEKLCSCSRTWMVSALACGNKWIQVGTYIEHGESVMTKFRTCPKAKAKDLSQRPKSVFSVNTVHQNI